MATLCTEDPRVSGRFELYYKGIELANGFNELTDHQEQAQRFDQDNQLRSAMGLKQVKTDKKFLAALASGIPSCAGVALGIDRLVMLATQRSHIKQTMAFDIKQA